DPATKASCQPARRLRTVARHHPQARKPAQGSYCLLRCPAQAPSPTNHQASSRRFAASFDPFLLNRGLLPNNNSEKTTSAELQQGEFETICRRSRPSDPQSKLPQPYRGTYRIVFHMALVLV